MCNICMLQFEAKALVELSASDEVWEGEIFLCVVCVCVFFCFRFKDQAYHMCYVNVQQHLHAGANPDDRLQKAYAEFTRMCKRFKIRP